MSIRSVDLQTMIPRLTETSRQQHNADSQPFVVQHAAAAEAQERSARSQRQVSEKPQPEKASIRKDREGNGQQAAGKGPEPRHKRREPEAGSKPAERQWGNRLDVKV